MPYDDFTRDFQALAGFEKQEKERAAKEKLHRASKDCTGKKDCPICLDFEEQRISFNPNLP